MAVSLQVSNFFNSFSRRRQISQQSGPIRLQPGPIATPAHHVTMSTSTLRANCAWIWRQNGYYAILGDVINHVQVTSEQDCSATQAATSEPPKQPPLELPKQPPLSKTAATSELPKQPPLSYSSSHLWAAQPQCQHRHETCMAFRLCRWALYWTQISANTTKLSPSGSTVNSVMSELVKVGKAHSSGAGSSYSGATCTPWASRTEFWASSFCSDIRSSTWWCGWCVCVWAE